MDGHEKDNEIFQAYSKNAQLNSGWLFPVVNGLHVVLVSQEKGDHQRTAGSKVHA